MLDIKRVLCPIDFSECSRHALDYARIIARSHRLAVTCLHVHPIHMAMPTPYGGPVVFEPRELPLTSREELLEQLRDFVKSGDPGDVSPSLEIGVGRPAEQILAKAKSLPADMIVLGTHGRSGIERLVLGSVAERVLRKASIPVLTVPPRAVEAAPPAFSRLLCAVDFSEASLAALRSAIALAAESDADLLVVHVLELSPLGDIPTLPALTFRRYHEELRRTAPGRLSAVVPAEARTRCEVHEMIAEGNAYREILRIADARQADLIVMGVRGRGVADLMTFGSTTQHVVRLAPCPVLTIHVGPLGQGTSAERETGATAEALVTK